MLDYEPRGIETFGKPEILAAAGAAILAWNSCEFTMHQLFSVIVGPKHLGTIAFHKTNNVTRLEILRYIASTYDDPIKSLLIEFAVQYDLCCKNRNLIAHATIIADPLNFSNTLLRKVKSKSVDQYNNFPVDEVVLLEIANGCGNVSKFGGEIVSNILSLPGGVLEGWRTASPEIPPRPRILDPQRVPDQGSV